ncbi:hypothetical protein J6590_020254, partial [Homalodisca vitripennis]
AFDQDIMKIGEKQSEQAPRRSLMSAFLNGSFCARRKMCAACQVTLSSKRRETPLRPGTALIYPYFNEGVFTRHWRTGLNLQSTERFIRRCRFTVDGRRNSQN